MQYSQLFQDTVARLQEAGVEDASTEAVLLFDFCFGLSRSQLFLRGNREVPGDALTSFYEVLQRRLTREPLQYITGAREFWSLDFIVTPAVLIPRPETEFLLEHLLTVCKDCGREPKTVLDMCTGSGVIAVVLTREFEAAKVVAVDRFFAALQVASANRAKFKLDERIHLVCSDLFSALSSGFRYDLIAANPPYIARPDFVALQPEVRLWEPHSALVSGEEGLDVIKQLADTAHMYLNPGGWMFVEIGADQKEKAEQLFAAHGSGTYEEVAVIPDWAGRPRVLQARKAGKKHE